MSCKKKNVWKANLDDDKILTEHIAFTNVDLGNKSMETGLTTYQASLHRFVKWPVNHLSVISDSQVKADLRIS